MSIGWSADADSEKNPRVCHGTTCWHADDAKRPGNGKDGPKGLTDAQSVLNDAETTVMGHGNGASTYLRAGGTKRSVERRMAQEPRGRID